MPSAWRQAFRHIHICTHTYIYSIYICVYTHAYIVHTYVLRCIYRVSCLQLLDCNPTATKWFKTQQAYTCLQSGLCWKQSTSTGQLSGGLVLCRRTRNLSADTEFDLIKESYSCSCLDREVNPAGRSKAPLPREVHNDSLLVEIHTDVSCGQAVGISPSCTCATLYMRVDLNPLLLALLYRGDLFILSRWTLPAKHGSDMAIYALCNMT